MSLHNFGLELSTFCSEGAKENSPGNGPLSRRDEMKVARHEMPGKWVEMIRPVGNGVIRDAGLCSPCKTMRCPRRLIIPYPSSVAILAMADKTGRASKWHVPRHFMPGYLHVVPTGQIHRGPYVGAHVQSEDGIRLKHITPTLRYSNTPRPRIRAGARGRARARSGR